MDDDDRGRKETADERSDRNWVELLQELRVMQTGVQILTGFLLTVPFQPRFETLTAFQRGFYLVLVVLAALTTGIAVAPVALHRALFRRHLKPRLVTVADRITRAALILLALLVTGVVGLVFDVVVGRGAAITAVALALAFLGVLWAVVPEVVKERSARD
ncbi:conserved hypothetical protein [Xylanimonas cellulosilytica DSM 15894]|uniref:Sodium:proton antiporter n=1 Tax=Xylanimonas cellulosilytica (strain DSM 15894 / JCM 12276 / CECT 5975 / KCTC 9989 / LMG 20990 / NBRC 107835 / XIL07) TaxID=446471 RepID=D1BTE0_XYLCX|nr:DUF6328 family protein [Xylanimonas cellulosilytica]ACZ29082.1 conserved hypothetical protein [Xylanimonas cellulosilytica DSM 15894]